MGDFLAGEAVFLGVAFLDSTGLTGDFCLICLRGVSAILTTIGESFLMAFDLLSFGMSAACFYFLFCFVVSTTTYFSVGFGISLTVTFYVSTET